MVNLLLIGNGVVVFRVIGFFHTGSPSRYLNLTPQDLSPVD